MDVLNTSLTREWYMSEQAEADRIVSVITCDNEGRIETFNKNAEKLFGYSAEEVVNKKRVSLFSPGMVVLGLSLIHI